MKIRTSIAVSSFEQLADLPDLKQIDSLEITSALRAEAFTVPAPAWKRRLHRMSFRSESRTITALIGSGSAMNRDFFRMFSGCCADCAKLGIREISLGVDWENTFSTPEYAAALREIFRCCFGIAVKYQLGMLLEVRIPGVAATGYMDFLRFRDSLLLPVRTLINFHPHEPGALDLMEKFSAALPFEVSCFRVAFDASDGNYLSARLLDRVRTFIHPVGREVPELCFYPGRSADKNAFAALNMVLA